MATFVVSYGCPDIWSDFRLVCLRGCFWWTLTYEMVDWVKQITLPNVGGPRPITWRLKSNKKAALLWGRRNSSAWLLELTHQSFPFFRMELDRQLSQLCHLHIMGPASCHKGLRQVLLSPVGSFLWGTVTNTALPGPQSSYQDNKINSCWSE